VRKLAVPTAMGPATRMLASAARHARRRVNASIPLKERERMTIELATTAAMSVVVRQRRPGDDEILAIAKDAGVTVTTNLDKEIRSHRYVGYVQSMTPKTPIAPGSAGIGTPTISINGETIALSALPAPDQLATRLQ
jgi:hypothetical protein